MKVLDFLGKIFAFLLTLLFFIVLFSLTTLIIAKDLTSPKGLAEYLKNIKIENINVSDILGKNYDINMSLTEEVSKNLEKVGIDEKITENVLKSDKLKEKLSEIIIGYTDYLAGEKDLPQIAEQDLKEIVTDELIQESIGRKLNYLEQESLDLFIKKATNEINEYLTTFTTNKVNETAKLIKQIISEKVILTLVISLIVIVILIGICRLSLYKPFAWISIPTILLGVMYLLINKIKIVLLKNQISTEGAIDKIINDFMNEITKKISVTGIYLVIIGIVLAIIYFVSKYIIEKYFPKKNKKDEELIEEL